MTQQADNTNILAEYSLRNLASMLDVPLTHGWKKGLSIKLGLSDQNIISQWTKRGRIPENAINLIEEKGYKRNKWIVYDEAATYNAFRETHAPYGEPEPHEPIDLRPRAPDTAQDIVKATRLTMEVMTSRHPEIKLAPMKNLEQFSEAVHKADELDGCKVQIIEQGKKLTEMDDKIKHLETQVEELLKREQQCGSAAPGDGVPASAKKAM